MFRDITTNGAHVNVFSVEACWVDCLVIDTKVSNSKGILKTQGRECDS